MPAGDVGTNWFIVELTSEPVVNIVDAAPVSFSAESGFEANVPDLHAPVVDTTQGGSGRAFWYGAGAPAFETFDKLEVEGSAQLLRITQLSFSGEIDLQRSQSVQFSGSIELSRKQTFEIDVEREAAHHYLQVVREDEELLMLI